MVNLSFASAFAFVLTEEGGYVNHPADPGGATNRGVTQRVYDAYRDRKLWVRRSVRECTFAETAEIYYSYWVESGAELCADAGKGRLALCTFDWGINAGSARARRYLQYVVGAQVDGVLGPVSQQAVHAANETVACDLYLRLRALHYRGRCGDAQAIKDLKVLNLLAPAAHAPSTVFLKGWLARLRRVAKETEIPPHQSYAK